MAAVPRAILSRIQLLVTPALLRRIGTAAAVAMTLVGTPLLVFSETSLRGIVDYWLTQCMIVVDIDQTEREAPIVRLYLFGEMPDALPLTLSASTGLVDRVSLLNHVEQDTTPGESNLLVHPLANQRCPGDLCPDSNEASEKLTIRIRPVSPNYVYQFRVLLRAPDPESRLKAYVKPLDCDSFTCRVERATLFNALTRQSRTLQAVILFMAVMVLTLLLDCLRPRTGASS